MSNTVLAIGLMSGTSMDGIDVAMIETDGRDVVRRGASRTYAYDPASRQLLAEALREALNLTDRCTRPGVLARAEDVVTQRHVEAVEEFLRQEQISRSGIDVIGFHGQTVLHRPEARLTVQIGDGAALSRSLGIPVVYDLRGRDVEQGGEGAPLAPVYHRAMAAGIQGRPLVILNIGGVSNITWIGGNGALIAFDAGPGGALLDDWVQRQSGGAQAFDADGQISAAGRVHDDVVKAFALDPYLGLPAPKSLDRNAFSLDRVSGLTLEDGAATLCAMTAEGIALGLRHVPHPPSRIVACGGGRKNSTLLRMIADRTGVEVVTADDVGFDGDSVEAEAWAYMAVRSRLGLPITFPGTTGAKTELSGGVLALPTAA
ncbi:MAG: anhydro-N-acetylmuramic acid kinase [Filomicrobium sp.]